MKQSTIIFSSLLAAAAMSTVPAWATDITVADNSRTQVENRDSTDTYTTDKGQIYISTYNSKGSGAFNCEVVLNGEGYQNDGAVNEAKAALRLDLGATLAGTVSIGGNTRIWSSGPNTASNTISGKISTKTDASEGSLTITGNTESFTGNVRALTFSGGMELTKGALKFEGTSASLTLSGTDKTYSAKSLANTPVSSGETAPTLTIDTGVTLTLSNTETTAGADQTFSGSLSGAGTLKIAGGVQKLSVGYSAETSISVTSGGILELAGTNMVKSATISGGVLKASVNAAGNIPLYAVSGVAFSDNAKLVLDLSGASVDSGVALTIISASAISYNNTPLSQDKILSLVDVNSSDFGQYSSWTQKWTLETNTYTKAQTLNLTLTNVPEPSAFGLLAGIGALVFVAARRRRRKA